MPPAVPILCSVRGCGRPLAFGDRTAVCPAGHSFDRARSGYWNLLQPQDRRAREPGDARAVVAARQRSLERGLGDPLRDALAAGLTERGIGAGAAALEVGCGPGFFLAGLAARLGVTGVGVDISAAAAEAAARRYPQHTWLVANADRTLPFPPAAFDAALSITGPKHAAELARVLRPAGWLVVAVPGADDLAELRAALLGTARAEEPGPRIAALFAPAFTVADETGVRAVAHLDAAGLADVLAGTYRGARRRERARLEPITALDVTISYRVLWLRPAR
jgi:23S rRNA (guanine745-N1)-methyltransferase